MKVRTITNEERAELFSVDARLRDLRFFNLKDIHFKIVPLEIEFLDSIEKCGKIDKEDYKRMYLDTNIRNQVRLLIMLDLREAKDYDIDNGLPAGTARAIKNLKCEESSGRARDNNNGEKTIHEQWALAICPVCGEYFSQAIGGKSSHSKYCSRKCKDAAAYKRKKAKNKVDPIVRDIKTVKSYIKGIEEISKRYPHHTGSELTLEALKKQLQEIEHEQF